MQHSLTLAKLFFLMTIITANTYTMEEQHSLMVKQRCQELARKQQKIIPPKLLEIAQQKNPFAVLNSMIIYGKNKPATWSQLFNLKRCAYYIQLRLQTKENNTHDQWHKLWPITDVTLELENAQEDLSQFMKEIDACKKNLKLTDPEDKALFTSLRDVCLRQIETLQKAIAIAAHAPLLRNIDYEDLMLNPCKFLYKAKKESFNFLIKFINIQIVPIKELNKRWIKQNPDGDSLLHTLSKSNVDQETFKRITIMLCNDYNLHVNDHNKHSEKPLDVLNNSDYCTVLQELGGKYSTTKKSVRFSND